MPRTSRIVVAVVVCVAAGLIAADDSPRLVKPAGELKGPIEKLRPFLGNWEIDAAWSSGQALWARNEYRIGLAGRFVEVTTYTRDANGAVYERYRTVFAHDAESDRLVSYGFTFDGSAKVVPVETGESDGKLALSSGWKDGKGEQMREIKQTVTLLDDNTYRWQVWTRPAGGEWSPMMDGQWKRVR